MANSQLPNMVSNSHDHLLGLSTLEFWFQRSHASTALPLDRNSLSEVEEDRVLERDF